jgi:hypothetical protein
MLYLCKLTDHEYTFVINKYMKTTYYEYSNFWSYLYENCESNKYNFIKLGIVNEFSKYMYKR